MTNKGKIVSLFSGCGGLDLGFQKAGFEIVYATDYDSDLKETYDANHDTELNIQDVRELDSEELPECDGVIGGPPCQSWSLAGNHLRGSDDERGAVFFDYIDVIEEKEPRFFVTENVPGIISKRNIDEFKTIIDRFEEIGYEVKYKKMNAAYHDVPQSRKRVIIVGVRKEADYQYEFPKKNDEMMTQRESKLTTLPRSNATDGDSTPEEELGYRNQEHYVGGYSSRYMSRNRVRSWDEPAYTVQANARHQKIHPKAPKMEKIEKDQWRFQDGQEDEYRRYSVREAAILQTFPESFEFKYDDVRQGYKMIGNAVPVNLAKSVANSIEVKKLGHKKAEEAKN